MTTVGGDVSLRLRDHGALALPAHTHSRRRTPHSNKVQADGKLSPLLRRVVVLPASQARYFAGHFFSLSAPT